MTQIFGLIDMKKLMPYIKGVLLVLILHGVYLAYHVFTSGGGIASISNPNPPGRSGLWFGFVTMGLELQAISPGPLTRTMNREIALKISAWLEWEKDQTPWWWPLSGYSLIRGKHVIAPQGAGHFGMWPAVIKGAQCIVPPWTVVALEIFGVLIAIFCGRRIVRRFVRRRS